MQGVRRSRFKLFLATAAAAALILCEHRALAAEQKLPTFSHGGPTKSPTALPSLPAEKSAPLSTTTFDTDLPGSATPDQESQAGNSTPSNRPGKLQSPSGLRAPHAGVRNPLPLVQSPTGDSGAARPDIPASKAGFPFPAKGTGAGLSSSGTTSSFLPSAEVLPGDTAPKSAPRAIPRESGAAGSLPSNNVPNSRSSSPEHTAAKGLSEMLAKSKFRDLTADALKTMCEQAEAESVVANNSDALNVTCISQDCAFSNEEHTQAKSAAMGEVCHMTSAEAFAEYDAAVSETIRHHAKQRLEQVFSKNIKGKLVVAVGLPANILTMAQSASQVIVIEMDSEACEKFLTSKEGLCTLRKQVQYVCLKPNTLTPEERALVTFETTEQLIKRHFHAMPPDLVLVSSPYPVALATKLFEELDQSSTLIVQHRLSFLALQALAPRYRQEIAVHPDVDDENLNPRSLVLFRRTYAPRVNEEYWRQYLMPEWRLASSEEPVKLLRSCTTLALEVVKSAEEPVAEELIRLYTRTLLQFWALASDEERDIAAYHITSISDLLQSRNVSSKVVKDVFRVAAESAAEQVMKTLKLSYYLRRLKENIDEGDDTKRVLYQALYCELAVVFRKIESTDTQCRAFKRFLRQVGGRLARHKTELPKLLHAVRLAVETFNDVKDARRLFKDTQRRCSLPSGKLEM